MSNDPQYLFGPVPSRRLGRSLGVDLIPFKTCSLDCIYCQLGDTPCAVSERGNYTPIDDVLAQLQTWLKVDGQADHITLAGSGEPTLHIHFGEVLKYVKTHSDIPSVLLTNGTLMHLPEVRESAALADKVKVTLSAWDEASFRRIHRPASGVTFDLLVEGERAFRQIYSGELSVEVFIVEGMNSTDEQCRRIAEIVHSLEPDRIDLNTVIRPPAMQGISAPSEARLEALAGIFGEKASVTPAHRKQDAAFTEVSEKAVLDLISRHPATVPQLAEVYNLPEDEMYKMLRQMVVAGELFEEERDSEVYFFCR